VIDIEKSSFNPLVFTTTRVMAPKCNRVNKRLAEKKSEKCREPYASVITYIRIKLRFAPLRSTLAATFFVIVMGQGTARSWNQAPNNATQTKQKAHKQE